jgi:hypothetical protein
MAPLALAGFAFALVGAIAACSVSALTVVVNDSSDGGNGVANLSAVATSNRLVSVADLGVVNARLAQRVTSANYLRDVNATGTLTVADKGLTNAVLTTSLPAP